MDDMFMNKGLQFLWALRWVTFKRAFNCHPIQKMMKGLCVMKKKKLKKHRVQYGHSVETVNGAGDIVRSFCNEGECWASLDRLSLTICLRLGGSNEKHLQGVYQVTLPRVVQPGVNALVWNKRLLINFKGLIKDPVNHSWEGIFYDCGKYDGF